MNKIHLADGAMGTMLQNMGLTPGESPDSWALCNPEAILTVHRGYVEAGAEMLTTLHALAPTVSNCRIMGLEKRFSR